MANEVNILGVVAVAFFIMVPVSFLLILFIKSNSEGNQSGGFSQEYYDASYKRGDKKVRHLRKGRATTARLASSFLLTRTYLSLSLSLALRRRSKRFAFALHTLG